MTSRAIDVFSGLMARLFSFSTSASSEDLLTQIKTDLKQAYPNLAHIDNDHVDMVLSDFESEAMLEYSAGLLSEQVFDLSQLEREVSKP